jgi:hypothetical protein
MEFIGRTSWILVELVVILEKDSDMLFCPSRRDGQKELSRKYHKQTNRPKQLQQQKQLVLLGGFWHSKIASAGYSVLLTKQQFLSV